MPLDPQLKGLLELLDAMGSPLNEGTPEEGRLALRAMSCDLVTPDQVVQIGEVTDLAVPGAEGDRPARLYRPATPGPTPTLVYFHGGGFVVGDLDTHDQTCRRIVRDTGVTVLSVDYRLAPEHKFPAGVEDALAATRWASEHLDELGGGELLAVGGDSAGGNLSAIVAQALPDAVHAQLLIYPAVDSLTDYPSRTENGEGLFLTTEMMAWFSDHYVGGLDELDLGDFRLLPILGELAGVAPAIVVTAELDPLRDEGEAYAAKLAALGVEVDAIRYDGLIHGFVDMVPASEACAAAVADVNARFAALLERLSA